VTSEPSYQYVFQNTLKSENHIRENYHKIVHNWVQNNDFRGCQFWCVAGRDINSAFINKVNTISQYIKYK